MRELCAKATPGAVVFQDKPMREQADLAALWRRCSPEVMLAVVKLCEPTAKEHAEIAAHNEGLVGMPSGPCSCTVCQILALLNNARPGPDAP